MWSDVCSIQPDHVVNSIYFLEGHAPWPYYNMVSSTRQHSVGVPLTCKTRPRVHWLLKSQIWDLDLKSFILNSFVSCQVNDYVLKIGVCVPTDMFYKTPLHYCVQNDPFQWNFLSAFLSLEGRLNMLVNMGPENCVFITHIALSDFQSICHGFKPWCVQWLSLWQKNALQRCFKCRNW